jgi:hypothetical protein
VELFGLSGMAHLQPLALERVVKVFKDFISTECKIGDHVFVYYNSYRLESDFGKGRSRSEFVFDLRTVKDKMCMSHEYVRASLIILRGGFVDSGNSVQPASIVISDGYGHPLLSIDGMTEVGLSQNLKMNASIFCPVSSPDSVPPSWLGLLERLVLSVKNFSDNGANLREKLTRELLLGNLDEFQLASNTRRP